MTIPSPAGPENEGPQNAAPQNAAPQNAAPRNEGPRPVAPRPVAPRPAVPRSGGSGGPGGGPARALQRVTASALGPYQSAVVRIGFAATYLFFLLRELPNRHELYGPDSPWHWDLARQLTNGNEAFSVLMWTDSTVWFEAVYALTLLSAAALLLGWRTRTMSVLFMVGVLSVQNRSIFMGDGGDNVVHLMAIYLVLTRCAQVWSLDARRAARNAQRAAAGLPPLRDIVGPALWVLLGPVLVVATVMGGLGGTWWLPALLWTIWLSAAAWWAVNRYLPHGEPRTLLDVLANLAHNATLAVIMAEVCLIYATMRLVQDPGIALAGRHRALLPAQPRLLHPVARAVGHPGRQRADGDGADVRHGHRAGRLSVHAVQPAGQERPAGRDDLRARGDRPAAGAAVLLHGDDRGRRGVPADGLPRAAGRPCHDRPAGGCFPGCPAGHVRRSPEHSAPRTAPRTRRRPGR